MPYGKWETRLAGRKVETFLQPNGDDEGYYRKPTAHKDPSGNGRWVITGWTPIALFLENEDSEKLIGLWGAGKDMRDLTDDELSDEGLWSWIVANPISYDWYKAVAEDGQPWPDSEAAQLERAQAEGKRAAENQEMPAEGSAEPKAPETVEEHRAAIKVLVDTAKATKTVTSDEEANVVAGTKNMLAERRLAADKAGKARYQPAYKHYKTLFDEWTPMVKAAEQQEKNLNGLILTWREKARKQREATLQAAQQQQEIDVEAEQRAADRAIVTGDPAPPPEVKEPDPIPEPPAPIKPTYGSRTVREELKPFVTIIDEAKVAIYFRGNPELIAVLEILALRAVKRGETVPGINYEERLA